MGERVRVIWGHRKAKYFLQLVWTGVIGLKGLMKLVFRRKGFWASKDCEGMPRGRDRSDRLATV
jgi:hypothetical protein